MSMSICTAGRAAVAALLLSMTAACDPMADQAKIQPYDAPPAGTDIPGALPPPEGAVIAGIRAKEQRPLPRPALVARGRERFGIYCTPCHGWEGKGDGRVAGRLVPEPPSFHLPRLEKAPDDYLFAVITHGHGRMYGYASRIPPGDRRAIVAWIRELQGGAP